MKNKYMRKTDLVLILMISAMACRKPYNPPAITGNGSYLVVEGIINSGTDSTIIKLSRTVTVSSKVTANPELNAILTIESNQNSSYPLTETTNGNYVSAGLNLDTSGKYRLRIKTADNQEYLSDFVPVKVTPPIDSIGFNITSAPDTGVQIYANAHDPTNNTRYYRWDYDENWEFHAKYFSGYIFSGLTIVPRSVAQEIYFCYDSNVSSTIVLGSSAKLAKDMIYQSPIVFIAANSEKIELKYSILVRQYALTSDAYIFWQNLKKNTEQLGSIFDAQPSQNNGNIHNISNPGRPAIGYVSACTVQLKRVYILNAQLPYHTPDYPYVCGIDTAPGPVPVTNLGTLANPKYNFTSTECADCTIRGSINPPSFWR
jgi:hypothetical protein